MLHDAPLEAGVIRYLLTHGYAARRCMDLRPEDLTNIDRSRMLHAIQQIATAGDQVTADGVISIMTKGGQSSAAHDVRKLIADSKRLEGIEGVVPILRDLASRRRLREPLLRLSAMTEDGDLSEVRAALRALTAREDSVDAEDDGSTSYDTRGMIAATMNESIARQNRPEMNMGPLDPLARHLAPGDMVTIGGESGAGKSQLAMYMGRKWGQGTGARIGIVSVEDRAHMWGDRALALECGASMLGGTKNEYTDDDGNMCRDDMEKITAAAAKLSEENPFHLEVMDRADVSDVERAMLRCIRNHCGLIVVDYVQEIFDKNATKGANQAERVGDITARIKLVAKRAKVPLILCSQLSRPAKGKTEPTKHDLRGSGRLLEQSEAVALLWKENEQDQDSMAKIVKLKMGGERPRVRLSRNRGGMISGIEEVEEGQRSGALAGLRGPR